MAGTAPRAFDDDQIDVVKLSGLVLLKILKHARETHPPLHPTGQLLGLDKPQGDLKVLELTNCFPNLPKEPSDDVEKPEDDANDIKEMQHQQAMLQQYKLINIDANVVGWYLVSWHQQFSQSHIMTLLDYQLNLWPKCICLIFDSLASQERDTLSLKAVRLKRSYVNAWKAITSDEKKAKMQQHILGEDQTSAILDEIPIEFYNTTVFSDIFSLQFVSSRAHIPPPLFDPYERSALTSAARSVQSLTEGADDIARDMSVYQSMLRKYQQAVANQYYQQGKAQTVPPPRMPLLYSLRQTSNLSEDLDQTSKQCLRHLYFTEALHQARMQDGATTADA